MLSIFGSNTVIKQWIAAVMANVPSLVYGMQAGWISPMIETLQSENSPLGKPITDFDLSLMASVMCLLAIPGAPILTMLADFIGRKYTLIFMSLLQTAAWAIKIWAQSSLTLIIARGVCGVAAAGCFTIIPMYVKEISQDSIRGTLGSLLIVFQNLGILAIFVLGSTISYHPILWLMTPLPLLHAICFLFMPESPSYLIKQHKKQEAIVSMSWLRSAEEDNSTVINEIACLEKENAEEKRADSGGSISLVAIAKVKIYQRIFLMGLVLISFQGGNGAFLILTYSSNILSEAGSEVNPNLVSITVPVLLLVGSFTSVLLVEKFGRKVFLVSSSVVFVVGSCSLGLLFTLKDYGVPHPTFLYVINMLLCVFAYAVGVSPVTFIVLSEVFNLQIRAKLLGPLGSCVWLITFVYLLAFKPIANVFGMSAVFCFLSAVNVLSLLFYMFCVPETKGKNIQEIEEEYARKKWLL